MLKHILVHNLVPGMIVAKDVYSSSNLLLSPAGANVTTRMISTLLSHKISSIYIDGEENVPITKSTLNGQQTDDIHTPFSESIPYKQFSQNFKFTTDHLKDQINDVITKNAPFQPDLLLAETTKLFQSDMTAIRLFDMIHHMRHFDDSTYVHSINVALICNVFGRWLNLSEKDVEVLTLCGLLHDIGKVEIPDSIIKKPSSLTKEEYDVVKRHPYKGYQILSKHKELDPRIAQAALLHHERCDGSGYPTGCKRNKITDFALIVAIADVYDAMTSNRVYRAALSPFKVIKILEDEGIQKYDPEFFLKFLEHIVNTYINSDVLLNDGRKAHVIFINKNNLARPIVKISSSIVDLSKVPHLEIEAIL